MTKEEIELEFSGFMKLLFPLSYKLSKRVIKVMLDECLDLVYECKEKKEKQEKGQIKSEK